MTSRVFAFVAVGVLIPLSTALASVTARTIVDFARAPLASRSAFAAMVHAASRNRTTPAIVLAGRARRVAVIQWDGGDRSLLVAPTKDGGFCKSLSGAYGGTGCISDRARRSGSELNPGLVGDASGPIAFNGTFFNAHGIRLEVRYQDGHRNTIPVIWVNGPINAGFFAYKIPAGQRPRGHRPVDLSLYSASNALLAHQHLSY